MAEYLENNKYSNSAQMLIGAASFAEILNKEQNNPDGLSPR
jgi:hypothetical protein